MTWMAVLVVSSLWLGLRQRKAGGSSTFAMLTITTLVLLFVYLFVLK